jgi:hypothetical protein
MCIKTIAILKELSNIINSLKSFVPYDLMRRNNYFEVSI